MSETLAGTRHPSDLDSTRSSTAAPVDAAVILDAVVEAILVFDPDSLRITEANRGATELLGRAHHELVGKSIVEVFSGADPRRLESDAAALAAGHADSTTLLMDRLTGEGDPIAAEVVLQPIDLPGGSRVIVAIARDIRGRLETQIRLQRLAELEHSRAAELNAVIRAMGEAVVVCAADGTITLSNPAGESIFPDVEERTYDDILGQLQDPEHLAPGLGGLGGPVELRTVADADRWIEMATYPVAAGTTAGGPPEATIVVMRDVTESRRREAIRETFIGVLSHELRTPVTTIFGGAKLLARERSSLDEETRRGIFRDIHEEAERLQRLVEDVVALNRFGEDVGDIGREPVLIQRLLPRVVESEDGRWPGVSFELEIASGLPTVSADPTYVEQVVRNLLSNAAKYGGLDSAVVIRAERGEGEVMVRVLDDGPGFPIEERDRLFELFYRSTRTATKAGGAGIGLFVCARLVAAMGGRIWATPRADGGSEFGFALPELSE
ncbi:MAG TPA: ATP-binding protein [Candidatus Limnocylindrales bacterium]|nr:ATP-binding protein [Candidatus Limnocylindrales bacterium]